MTRRILLVEDDIFFQKFYSSKLIENGYEVITVNNGREAISKLESDNFDLILLDLVMPEVDGFEVRSPALSKDARKEH